MTCNEQCLRELLAGVELELGDRDEVIALERQRAAAAEQKKYLAGAIGAVLGALLMSLALIGAR